MGEFLEAIKRIGIFMIAAQAVIHFAPGQKYEKYMKLIVSIMILMQFIMPIYTLLGGDDMKWSEMTEEMERNMTWATLEQNAGFEEKIFSLEEDVTLENTMIIQIQEEIKTKLNNYINKEKYKITDVTIMMKTRTSENVQNLYEEDYELDKVRIEMCQSVNNTNEKQEAEIGKIEIDKIQIQQEKVDDELIEQEKTQDATHEIALQFRKEFSEILGIQEENMEVVIYGADE
ncbi:MAG: stage III sporulation protein AF [Lachnospiraceae bacterium]|nr:stage III sporulation protein AF [Lachnospiraceae bacterium]